MLYACSILYKLPMVLVFNRADVHDAAFAREWTTDFKAFQRALRASEQSGGGEDALGMSSLLNSMSLVLAIDEFYSHLDVVAVSTTRDIGIDDFLDRQKSPQLVELPFLSPSLTITLKSRVSISVSYDESATICQLFLRVPTRGDLNSSIKHDTKRRNHARVPTTSEPASRSADPSGPDSAVTALAKQENATEKWRARGGDGNGSEA